MDIDYLMQLEEKINVRINFFIENKQHSSSVWKHIPRRGDYVSLYFKDKKRLAIVKTVVWDVRDTKKYGGPMECDIYVLWESPGIFRQ